ncbi:hypothetical protein ACFS07_14720 [Undibacterium arcticum]
MELAGLLDTHTKAEAERQRASSAFVASDAALKSNASRAPGTVQRPVGAEKSKRNWPARLPPPKTLLSQHTQASNDGKQAQTRTSEALEQAKARLTSHSSEAQAAAEHLADWINRVNVAKKVLPTAPTH